MSFLWRMVGRELARQGSRLLFIVLCLAVGFAAFFATYGFSGRVLAGIRSESRVMLGADLAISGNGLLPQAALDFGDDRLAGRTVLYDFPSMASTDQGPTLVTRLVEVRAIDAAYPLVGRLEMLPPRLPGAPQGVWVDRGLAQAWNLQPAKDLKAPSEALLAKREGLRLGNAVLPIVGIVQTDDSRQAAAFALGPRVYIARERAESLGLVTARARLSGRILLTVNPGAEVGLLARLKAELSRIPRLRLQTHEEAATALARPIRNLNRFVQQLGLFTLLLSSLGAWAILTAYLEGRTGEAAILRCLGVPPGFPAQLYGLITALIFLTALLVGLAAGTAAANLLPRVLGELLPSGLRQGSAVMPPLLEGVTALTMVGLVALPSLVRLSEVGPLALLRSIESKGRRSLSLVCGIAAAGLATMLMVRNAPTPRIGAFTAAGMALLFLALFGASRLLVAAYRRTAERLPLALKLALGQLGARPILGALMMSVMGLAVFLVLATQFIKDDIVSPLAAQKGAGKRPNLFFIDVQPDQIEGLRSLLRERTGREPMASPLVRARLAGTASLPAKEADPGDADNQADRFRRREQNLTARQALSDSETVLQGRFWPPTGPPLAESSLEEGFAKSLGLKVGDELAFDVQGVELKTTITSLRRVQWQSFQPNFFIVLHPSLLEGAPAVWIVALEVDAGSDRMALQTQVAGRYPSISALDVGEVVARIGRVLDLVALVTRTLAGVMLASALLVLAASLLAGRLGRQRDLALLRTMGAPHGTLLASLAWEFFLLGGSAAAGAGILAWTLARAYTTKVLELPANPSPLSAILLLLLAATLSAAVGLLGSLRALNAKPMDVLRSE